MSIEITINGTPRGMQTLSISSAQNNRDRCTFKYMLPVGTTGPAIDDEIIVTEDQGGGPIRIFGGTVKEPTISGLAQTPTDEIEYNVNALDFNELGDRQIVTLTIPAGTTLKAAATMLLPYMDGVTLNMSVNGPALPQLTYEVLSVTKVLDDLCANTGWLRNIDYYKVLSFWEPGTWDAPWDIQNEDGNTVGDVSVKESRTDYANQVIVRFSEAARYAYIFLGPPRSHPDPANANFRPGEEVTLGSHTYTFVAGGPYESYQIQLGATGQESHNILMAAVVDGGASHAGVMDDGIQASTQMFAYNMGRSELMTCFRALEPGDAGNSIACTTNAVEMYFYGEGGVDHDTFHLGSDEALTNSVVVNDTAQQALYGVYSRVVDSPSIFSPVDATALGTQVLSISMVVEREITYDTYRSGLFVGMSQWIEVFDRNIDESCLITAINYNLNPSEYERRTVTAISGTRYDGSKWRDLYKAWLGSSGSGTSMTFNPGATSGNTVVQGPVIAYLGGSRFHAVQIP